MTSSVLQWLLRRLAWESFANPAVETAWRHDFHASQLNLDITACILAIVMTAFDAPQAVGVSHIAPRLETILIVIFFSTTYASNLAILWLIRYRRDWFVTHRTSVLICFKLSRITIYTLAMWYAPTYYLHYAPLELPPGQWKAVFKSLFMPSIMARFAIMWQLPVADTRLTSGVTLAVGLYDAIFIRCRAELDAVPAQGARYLAAVEGALKAAVQRGLPVPTLASQLPGAGAAGVSGYGACIAAKSTAQIIVGTCLPLCAVLAVEAASRTTFALTVGLGYTLRPSLAGMAAQNLLLLPLQACLVLTTLVLGLRWAGI